MSSLRVAFTESMRSVVEYHCTPGTLAAEQLVTVVGPPEEIASLADRLEARAAESRTPKDGAHRQLARHAAKRCRDAIARAARKAAAPVPVSITLHELDALKRLERDRTDIPSISIEERLRKRELIDGDFITQRGHAVLQGTPPGDLVPFAFFKPGVRVKLAHTLVGSPGQRELAAGMELHVTGSASGRLYLNNETRTCGVPSIHPRVVLVLGPPRPTDAQPIREDSHA